MKSFRHTYIWAIGFILFALMQTFAASGKEASYPGDSSTDYGGDSTSCPPPHVLSYDSTIYLCEVDQICFDVVAVNSGGDSLLITQVEGPGQFEMLTDTSGQTCFTPIEVDSTTYMFGYTVDGISSTNGDEPAPDSPACNWDTVRITVVLNQPPYVNMAEDFSILLCHPENLCFPAHADDLDFDIDSVWTEYGSYHSATNQFCFYADTPGVYTLILNAVDTCAITAADTTIVTVELNSAPVAACPGDDTLFVSNLSDVCVAGFVCNDPDDNLVSCVSSPGTLNSNTVCFTPVPGPNTITLIATDNCSEADTCQTTIHVVINSPPVVSGMPDTTLYLCYPQEICLPVEIFDQDGDIDTIIVNRGSYNNDSVCFIPYDSGHYEIIVTAVDSYGNVGADTAIVVIETDQGVSIECPDDTYIFTCQLVDTFCFPIVIHGFHENIEVEGINTWYDPLTDSTGNVCFWSACGNTNHITVRVTTPCNTYSCDFTVTVVCNSNPLVILPPDTTVVACETDDICLPVGISDVDGNLSYVDVDVDGGEGYYNSATSKVCFTPDTTIIYLINVTAHDACKATGQDQIAVQVVTNSPPEATCPDDDTLFVCDLSEICIDGFICSDPDGNLTSCEVSPGTLSGDTVCFTPVEGANTITLIATDACGEADTAEICVIVEMGDFVQIDCPLDTIDIWLCNAGEVFWPLDIMGDNYQVQTSSGTWHNDSLCFFANTNGLYNIEVIATSECNKDTCYVLFDVLISEEVSITCPSDTTVLLCGPDTRCFQYGVSSNVDSVRVSPPAYIINDSTVCVPLLEAGDSTMTMIADGPCGSDTCTFTVTARFNSPPDVDAGNDTTFTLCDLSEICIPFTATDIDTNIVNVTSSLGVVEDSQVCFTPQDFETYDIIIAAVDECGASDSDTVVVTVNPGGTVNIVCPSDIQYDTICGPTTICDSVTIMPENAQVTVLPPTGYYDSLTSQVCIPVDQSDTINVTVIAEALCGSDTCVFTLDVTLAQPPEITCPNQIDTMLYLIERDTLCYPVSVVGTISQIDVSPIGFYYDGQVCIPVDTAGIYEIEIAASGVCGTDTCFTTIEISDVCIRLSIDGGESVPVGVTKEVDMFIETDNTIGGFDILLKYDVPGLTFLGATDSCTDIESWEYFTYRDSALIGLVRFIGIADINNGAHHPPDSSLSPDGLFIEMQFYVSNDQNLGGWFLPISFIWYDCGDNTFSNVTGDDLYVDLRIFNMEGTVIWDEQDDVNFPESLRSYGLGAPDICVEGGGVGKPKPIRCIEFINGGICVTPPESLDLRGDVNLNGIPYEIADAVLFTNYFIYGLSVFRVNLAGQIAATDINADGLTLSVADMVYLIRVIIGDADPIPKLTPYDEELSLSTDYDSDVISITSHAVSDIGAALFVYDINDNLAIDEPRLAPGAEEMDLMYGIEEGQLKVLIYNIGTNRIPAGTNRLVEIPYRGNGQLNLTHAEIVDYQGRPYMVSGKVSQIPTGFVLSQNYPNPFNPTTTISFSLPQSTGWTLNIYNISGGLVREYRGSSEAGTITLEWNGRTEDGVQAASGVYFYRLEAADFTETRKMILLK